MNTSSSIGELFRKELLGIKRLVVKVGSNVVTTEDGQCDNRKLRILVEDICELKKQGIQLLLVSSGAVNLGRSFLDPALFKEKGIEAQQAASSLGQPRLMQKYCSLFEENNSLCSQILLTHEDFKSRQRYLNAQRTLEVLLASGVTPVLNENDTISFVEITVGDNDHLASQAALLMQADALLLITNSEGLFDKDPNDPEAKLISEVMFGQDLAGIDLSATSSAGRGGMKSKLEAVRKACGFGIKTIISTKERERFVMDPITKEIGTYFHPKQLSKLGRRKLWLASLRSSESNIMVDEGAFKALLEKKSLLARGIVGIEGDFSSGDCVNLSVDGQVFARGICFFSSSELERIKGCHSEEIENLLGPGRDKEVVHTENLVLEKELF